jgi:hypothetical protein
MEGVQKIKSDIYSKNLKILIIHVAFNPENRSIITYWLCYWSLNKGANIFLIEKSNLVQW